MSFCCAVPYPCIVNASVTSFAVFVLSFLLFYWLPSRPRVVVARLYTVKEDGSIESAEPSSPQANLLPEEWRVIKEKAKVLKEVLRREDVQRIIKEWRKPIRRRILVQASILAITVFIGDYLLCRFVMCPTSLP
uniref:Uncharacterized protein n=1 Tax=Ignisphaera aggregans TaxID=334771 RepID=A0A7J2U6N9_9CREN